MAGHLQGLRQHLSVLGDVAGDGGCPDGCPAVSRIGAVSLIRKVVLILFGCRGSVRVPSRWPSVSG